ncbi:fungal-specific transcription factor domain-containing protein [Linnemannia elongata]|nr:fungal-specific transcription factor domain-containing protein [Linnemannia elongata]
MHENTNHSHFQVKAFWSNLAQEAPATSLSSTEPSKLPPKKPSKRIRISTACINCRQKKIKCDGQVPCSHCEKFRTECVYPAVNKPANQEYVETLENRLKSVESHLQGLLSRGIGKGLNDLATDPSSDDMDHHHHNAPYTPASVPATPPSKPPHDHGHSSSHSRHHSYSIPLIRQFSGASISTPNLTGPDSDTEDATFTTDDSMDVLSLLMGSLKVDRDGAAQYIPKVLGQKERSYNDARTYNTSPLSHLPDFSTLDWQTTDLPLPYTLPNTLLTPKAISALLDIYFNSVHTFLPVIHKTSFLTLCQEGEFRVPPFLLMAICAVAARHATDFELQDIPDLANLKGHHALYDHARALLDTYMDVPRLSTVQGLLLLAYYQTKEKRSGHFFRIRMYVNLATRMALDMGLNKALRKSILELESSNTGDSLASTESPSFRPASSHTTSFFDARANANNMDFGSRDQSQKRLSQEKRVVLNQENRLAWLGCFFLDGLTSSLMGQDYCVSNASLDIPKLIQEAGQMPDTVQGATLIFWLHHLELVQIYRRICSFYRTIANEQALAKAIKGAEMLTIQSSIDSWLLNLPAHLVYTDSQSTGGALPSYYTLYLHRFFYSHRLLLYRPLISNKSHRGDLKDSNSPIAKCSQAALMLTQIGEIIFQNYSWPWPGCGLFAYHMLQAAEIHVFQMITQSLADSQSLYYRTMDLIKGYVSLAKLPELEKDVMAMEETVSNFLLTPQGSLNQQSNMSSSGTIGSSSFSQQQQQQHQNQQQQFVATPASDYSYASVMSPSSPAESVQRMPMQHSNNHGGYYSNHQQGNEDADMFSPLQAHAYPTFESASRVFRQPQGASTVATATTTAAAAATATTTNHFMGSSTTDSNTFSIGFDLPSISSVTATQGSSTSNAGLYATNGLPFYSSTTEANSMNMFDSNHQGGLYNSQSSFVQPILAPVGDLLGIGNMDNRVFGSNSGNQGQGSSMPSPSFTQGADNKKKSVVPPPKPPKRILPQSTGSSSSSAVSQSLKPPVPKKPTRLTDAAAPSAASAPRWIAPRPLAPAVTPLVPLIPANSGKDLYYGAKPSSTPANAGARTGGNGHGAAPPPPPPYTPSGAAPGSNGPVNGAGRTFKTLQPQSTLYGMGALVNTLGVEQQIHEPEPEPVYVPSERSDVDIHEHAMYYLQMNPQLYDPLPPNNRRRLL